MPEGGKRESRNRARGFLRSLEGAKNERKDAIRNRHCSWESERRDGKDDVVRLPRFLLSLCGELDLILQG